MIRLKRVAVALCGLILALHFFGATMAQTSEAGVSGQITYLIDYIRTSPCTFIRNGSDYDGVAAAAHIQQKYDYYKNDIHNVEDFISLAASKSYLSGRPYQVRCPGEKAVLSTDWLHAELKAYMSRAGKTGGAN